MTLPDRCDAQVTAFLPTQIGSMAAQRFAQRVERQCNEADRRVSALQLTSTGRRRLREVTLIAYGHGGEMLTGLDEHEQDQLQHLLTRLAGLSHERRSGVCG